MKKMAIIAIVISLFATILPAVLISLFIGGNDALGALLILLLTLYPIVSIVVGILSGVSKPQWYIPIINALIFLVVYTIVLTFDFTLVIASVIYAAIGIVAILITRAVKNKKAK